jgi:hypothetical protein
VGGLSALALRKPEHHHVVAARVSQSLRQQPTGVRPVAKRVVVAAVTVGRQ